MEQKKLKIIWKTKPNHVFSSLVEEIPRICWYKWKSQTQTLIVVISLGVRRLLVLLSIIYSYTNDSHSFLIVFFLVVFFFCTKMNLILLVNLYFFKAILFNITSRFISYPQFIQVFFSGSHLHFWITLSIFNSFSF